MPVAIPMKHDEDPKSVLFRKLRGVLEEIEVFNNQVLVALYDRPEQTKSGIILTEQSRDEEQWQGKAALIVQHGATAFKDPTNKWFVGVEIGVGDWIVMRPSDGWPLVLNEVKCRIINDTAVRARLSSPDLVW